jgi:ribosome modulation factor
MDYPAHLKSAQTRTAYTHGYEAAMAGREPRPYAGKLTRNAYEEGYTKGLNDSWAAKAVQP